MNKRWRNSEKGVWWFNHDFKKNNPGRFEGTAPGWVLVSIPAKELDSMSISGKAHLEVALEYAGLGFKLFPLIDGDKKPKTRNGFLDATTDRQQIEAWWGKWPSANIGLATEGLIVIDVDGRENTWPCDEEKIASLDGAPLSITPSGGRHYLFRQPAGKAYRNTTGKLAHAVDTRANGGYIVVPPSRRKEGGYHWIEGLELDSRQDQLPEPPEWLVKDLDALAGHSGGQEGQRKQSGSILEDGNPIPDGQRNWTLSRLAGYMRRAGMSQAEILAALLKVNRDRCKPSLADSEVEKIAESNARYEPDQATVAGMEGHYEQMFRKHGDHGEFPTKILPKCLAEFVNTVSRSVCCDPAYVALPALSALAAAIGTSRRIKLKDGWVEPSIIWTAVVADSGTGKSAPFDACMQPLKDWQEDEKWRTLTCDATTESLVGILSENPRGLILARDELSGWFGGFGAYKGGSGGDVATWLEMYGGRAYFTDRVGRGSIKVPRSSVSVSGTIQPMTLSGILKPEFRANGLLARFLLAAPPRKKKVWHENGIPDQMVKNWKKLVWDLLDFTDEKELRLDEDAKALYVDFFNESSEVSLTLPSDETAAWSKLEGYCARLALVLQMVASVTSGGSRERIEAPAMQTAIKLIDWFKAETNRVYSLMNISARKSTDENLLAFIRSRGGQVTVRDVSQNYRPLKNKEEEIEKKFRELAKQGYGTVEQQGKSIVFKLK